MKAVVKTVTGETYTLNSDVTNDLLPYFTGKPGQSYTSPLGWVTYFSDNGNRVAINIAHVVHIEFK